MPLLTIVGQPGLHHNFLRYILDRASGLTPEINQLPFKSSGTSHGDVKYSDSIKIIQNRSVNENDIGPFVLCVADDLLYFERASMSREGDRNNNLKHFEQFKDWQPWNNHYVDKIRQKYKLEKDAHIPKFIIRDSIKKGYLDLKSNGLILENNRLVNSVKNTKTDNYFFPVSSFFTLQSLQNELTKLNLKYKLKLDLNKITDVYDAFVKSNKILQTHSIVDTILEAVTSKKNILIPELDVFQEGYLYAKLEQNNDFILMPMINNFFINTQDIIEYIEYYPEEYKAMNPNLPTFNGIPNPYYLAKLQN